MKENIEENKIQGVKNYLELRKARKDDIKFLFDLRNDSSVRKSSFNTNPINLETHRQWFDNKLQNKDSLFFIAEYNTQKIGQIRFDKDEKMSSADVSIAVLPIFRQKGFGLNILEIGCKKTFEKLPIQRIRALIKKENFISVKFFSKAGFTNKGYSKYKDNVAIEMHLEKNSI